MDRDESPNGSTITPETPAAQPGLIGGRYRVVRPIGRGAAAYVYLARDEALGREVAVKMLTEQAAADPGYVERFRREAKAIASLNHPNIVTVYDWGETGDTYYMVMEYLPEGTLGELLARQGRLAEEESLRIAEGIADALAAAHAHDIVHRDIKPDNVLLTADHRPKVVDFGIAWAEGVSPLTLTNAICGTISYISPEQARGRHVDGRSDLYSLGVVLYRMLTGELPFRGSSMVDVAIRHIQEAPIPPRQRRPDISSPTDRVVMTALAKRPEDRHNSARDMGLALKRAREALAAPIVREPVPRDVPRPHHPTGTPGTVREVVPVVATRAPAVKRNDRSQYLRWVLALPLLFLGLGALVLAAHPWTSQNQPARRVAVGTRPAVHPTAEAGRHKAKPTPRAIHSPSTSPSAATSPRHGASPTQQRGGTSSGGSTAIGANTGSSTTIGANAGSSSSGTASSTAPAVGIAPVSEPGSAVSEAPVGAAPIAPAPSGGGPATAVVQFYTAVAQHQFADAAALWSPSMLKTWGRKQGIDDRFADTRSISVRIDNTAVDPASGTATVAVDITEQTSSGLRHYVGTWQLIQSNGSWLLDSPHLALQNT